MGFYPLVICAQGSSRSSQGLTAHFFSVMRVALHCLDGPQSTDPSTY